MSNVLHGWKQLRLTDRILLYIAFVLTVAFIATMIEQGAA